jgi:predicted nucleic acid-binding protein
VTDCFLDTNILLYAVSTNPIEADKTRAARVLVQSDNWAWSAQVAAEFIRASTSPRQPKPLTRAEALRWIQTWMAFPIAAVDGALVVEAVQIAERFQISHFDAQILAAAKRMGCSTLYSEDLNHGQDYAGVRVINPFLREK